MLKKITWVTGIIMIMVFITGGAAYYVLIEKAASPEPEVSRGMSPDIALSEIKDDEESINSGEREFTEERQRLMLAEQQENLEKIQEEINQNIELALSNIREKYQEKINKKETEVAEEVNEFLKAKEQEFTERLMVKKNFYEQKLEEMSAKIEEEKSRNLAQYQGELDKKYYNEILNYNLKLGLLELTEEEEEKYREELEKIREEKKRLLVQKENELKEQFKKDIAGLENNYEQKITLFGEELEDEINAQIRGKEVAVKKELSDYVLAQQDLMREEMEEKREELIARGRKELEYQQSIVQNLKKEYERMQKG